jgi:hypothetical protein
MSGGSRFIRFAKTFMIIYFAKIVSLVSLVRTDSIRKYDLLNHIGILDNLNRGLLDFF